MGALAAIHTHQLLGFISNHLGSHGHGNKLGNLQKIASTTVIVSPAADTKSASVRSCKVRQSLLSRSYTIHLCKSQLVQDFASTASVGYAVLLLGGGLFGYIKSGSKGSLLGGLTGATLIISAYFLMQASETKETGDALAFGTSLLFAFIFRIRFAATRKLIPAGLLLGFSISLMAVTFSAYVQNII